MEDDFKVVRRMVALDEEGWSYMGNVEIPSKVHNVGKYLDSFLNNYSLVEEISSARVIPQKVGSDIEYELWAF